MSSEMSYLPLTKRHPSMERWQNGASKYRSFIKTRCEQEVLTDINSQHAAHAYIQITVPPPQMMPRPVFYGNSKS